MISVLKKYFECLGVSENQHILVHSSFHKIKTSLSQISIEDLIDTLQKLVTEKGSVIMPSFTYCFEHNDGRHEIFDHEKSPSKVGAVSEIFRLKNDVIRTSSPTHSFSLWGKSAEIISPKNSPDSPLGEGSVLDWMTYQKNSSILLIGVDFNALSFGHYLENMTPVSWADIFPWDYMNIEKIGISSKGEQKLKEIPGCSKSFRNFEKYLLDRNMIEYHSLNHLKSTLIPVNLLFEEGLKYFKLYQDDLLCQPGSCEPCDCRRKKLQKLL